jgi:DNA (cytosine-5)-methyltransferase 1
VGRPQRRYLDSEEISTSVLDLFCGAGGLAQGFKAAGFDVTGVDVSENAGKTFELNQCGRFQKADLSKACLMGTYDVVVGGPPCKPWSAVNTTKRGKAHSDYILLSKFFEHIELLSPKAFLLENVPLVAAEPLLKGHVARLKKRGYSICGKVIRYSDFGASTKRHRYVLFGAKVGKSETFFCELSAHFSPPRTVKDAIWNLRKKEKNEVADHVWPELRTIGKYIDNYKSHKFGWYILNWDEPAPSFGNVMKTYILHPDAFNGGSTRVVSVKEASLIMGFDSRFRFPKEIGLGMRYQMVVDSVSPVFSRVAARIIRSQI